MAFCPTSLKSAIVKSLLQKSTLNQDCFKNCRPVFNLSFLSKVIKKVVAVRLFDHMKDNNLLDPTQSAYKPSHSTETALLKVYNNALLDLDQGRGVFQALWDLSAAFDMVDHEVLLNLFESCLGVGGSTLCLSILPHTAHTRCFCRQFYF